MGSLYQWLVFIHVLAGFAFLLSHGSSIAFSFQLKREKDLTRIQALFDLSGSMWIVTMISILVIFIVGIILGFIGNWWSSYWIWISLVISLGVTIWMFVLGQGTYHPMRKAFGLPYMNKGKEQPAEKPAPEEERADLIARTRPREMLVISLGGFIIILWLMMFKPF